MDKATSVRLRQLAREIEQARSVVVEDSNVDTRRVWSHFLSDWHSRLSTWGLTPGHYLERPIPEEDNNRES